MSLTFEALEDLPSHRDQAPEHGRFVLIFVGVVGIHLILLFNLSIDFRPALKQQTLRIKLTSAVPLAIPLVVSPVVAPEVRSKPPTLLEQPLDQPLERPLETETATRSELVQIESIETPPTKPEVKQPLPEKRLIQAWLPRAKAFIHKRDFAKPPQFKTFSSKDFPTKANKNGEDSVAKFYRGPAIQTYVRQRSQKVVEGNDGMLIIKSNDGFGNVKCFQERGTVSTFEQTNPTLWYPVPLSTCGHIK